MREKYPYQRELRITKVPHGCPRLWKKDGHNPIRLGVTFLSPSSFQAPVAAVWQHKHDFPETQNFMMQTPSKQNYGNSVTIPAIIKLEQQKAAM